LPPDSTGGHRVFVIVEAHQAGLGDHRLHHVKAVEPAGIGNEFGPLIYCPDYRLRDLNAASGYRLNNPSVDSRQEGTTMQNNAIGGEASQASGE
jgi:hypothetical protein